MKVLVAEDDRYTREGLAELLEGEGYQVGIDILTIVLPSHYVIFQSQGVTFTYRVWLFETLKATQTPQVMDLETSCLHKINFTFQWTS